MSRWSLKFLFFIFYSFNLWSQIPENKLDQEGRKHGFWKGIYEESKRPRYEGTFEHGKEVGVFNFFDDTKAQSLLATRTFSTTDNSVYIIFYDQNKNIVSQGKVINKQFEGPWKYYHQASKELMTLENYSNGKLVGLRNVFFLDGKIAAETNYKNGVKEGIYKKYTEKGVVLEKVFFKNGEFEGEAIYKDPNDNIVAKGVYKNGLKVGIWEFFENGKPASQDNFDKQRKRFKAKQD